MKREVIIFPIILVFLVLDVAHTLDIMRCAVKKHYELCSDIETLLAFFVSIGLLNFEEKKFSSNLSFPHLTIVTFSFSKLAFTHLLSLS